MSSVQLCHSRKEDVTAPCVINCPRMWNNNEVSKKRKLEESKPAPAPTFAFGAPPAPTFGFGTPAPSPTDTIRRTGVARRTGIARRALLPFSAPARVETGLVPGLANVVVPLKDLSESAVALPAQ